MPRDWYVSSHPSMPRQVCVPSASGARGGGWGGSPPPGTPSDLAGRGRVGRGSPCGRPSPWRSVLPPRARFGRARSAGGGDAAPDGRGERQGGGVAGSGSGGFFGFGLLLELADDDVALEPGQEIDDQPAVQVVDLVLDDGRQQALG